MNLSCVNGFPVVHACMATSASFMLNSLHVNAVVTDD